MNINLLKFLDASWDDARGPLRHDLDVIELILNDFLGQIFDRDGRLNVGQTVSLPTLNASELLGRGASSGSGSPEAITLGSNLSMAGTVLNASGITATTYLQSTILNHSQISGLGTTPIVVVTTPGSGFANYLIAINTASNFSAGAYNNPSIFFRYAGNTVDLVPASSNTLNTTTKRIQNLGASDVGLSTSVAENKDIVISASSGVTGGNAANQYAITALYTKRAIL